MAFTEPLRIGIIGAGRAARSLHVPALVRLGDRFNVRAVADLNSDAAAAICASFPGARAVVDAAEVFAAPDIDAVAIVTPPATHASLAIAALRAGKHVLVEKPLAASAEETQQMIRAARDAGRCAAVGQNLRFHRLVRRAREALRSGSLGNLLEIQTVFSSVVNDAPAWLSDPEQGGGLVFDIGVHHIDLARFLTGREFIDLSSDGPGERRTQLQGVLENGAQFNARLTRDPPTVHTIRLVGTAATVEFAMYSAMSWRHSARPGKPLADFVHGVGTMRSGGDSAESYRHEWLDFAEAVRAGSLPGCPFEHGARSAVECRSLVDRQPARAAAVVAGDSQAPALSVVLGVHGEYPSVRRTVRHLRAQTARQQIELILIFAGEAGDGVPPGELDGFFSSVVDAVPAGSSVAVANAAGVQRASAPVVAFAEDHCFPEPEWAQALIDAHAGNYAAVGPEMLNANPGSVVSWCDFLIGYGPWMSPAQGGEAPFLPGHNSSYKREILLAYGDRLEAMLEAETVLHFDLANKGHRLHIEPRARAAHLNFALWSVWLPVQFHYGRLFGGTRSAQWVWPKKLFYAAASPLIPAVRLLRSCGELLRPRRPRHMIPRLLPALALGLICDGAGQMVGYLCGVSGSPEKLANMEYNRVRYIRPEDRRALEEADGRGAT